MTRTRVRCLAKSSVTFPSGFTQLVNNLLQCHEKVFSPFILKVSSRISWRVSTHQFMTLGTQVMQQNSDPKAKMSGSEWLKMVKMKVTDSQSPNSGCRDDVTLT